MGMREHKRKRELLASLDCGNSELLTFNIGGGRFLDACVARDANYNGPRHDHGVCGGCIEKRRGDWRG